MAKQSFADIFDQWEKSQEQKKKAQQKENEAKQREPKDRKETPQRESTPFSDIYSQWLQTHDEDKAMDKKARSADRSRKQEPSINQIRNMAAQDELDLHEMKLEASIIAANAFLESSYHKGLRKVRIITGKGLHSKKGEAVLRPAIIKVAENHSKVREVSIPKANEGGSGALNIILKNKA